MKYNGTVIEIPISQDMSEFTVSKLPNHLKRDEKGRVRPKSKRYRILYDNEIVSEVSVNEDTGEEILLDAQDPTMITYGATQETAATEAAERSPSKKRSPRSELKMHKSINSPEFS